jgi:hypothetical protein
MILPATMSRGAARAGGPRPGGAAAAEPPWARPERFACELVLRDLERSRAPEETERIVARFVVARLAFQDPTAGDPMEERTTAAAYVALVQEAEERHALRRLLRHTDATPLRARAGAFLAAADAAAGQRHPAGAFLFYQEAFELARLASDRRQGALAARGMAQLGRAAGAPRFARAWAARARRLERARAQDGVIIDAMAETYSREQRGEIERAVRAGVAVDCPECGEPLVESHVPPRRDVAYVRRRLWLLCPGCRRSASVDVTADGRP